jgi:hypothetical protein
LPGVVAIHGAVIGKKGACLHGDADALDFICFLPGLCTLQRKRKW